MASFRFTEGDHLLIGKKEPTGDRSNFNFIKMFQSLKKCPKQNLFTLISCTTYVEKSIGLLSASVIGRTGKRLQIGQSMRQFERSGTKYFFTPYICYHRIRIDAAKYFCTQYSHSLGQIICNAIFVLTLSNIKPDQIFWQPVFLLMRPNMLALEIAFSGQIF